MQPDVMSEAVAFEVSAFQEDRTRGGESGVILLALIAAVLPLLILVGAMSRTMIGRDARLLSEVADEKAFLAAESGVDGAIYLANTGVLTGGVTFQGNLGGGMTYAGMPVDLSSDGVDNDGDTEIDESDENLWEITVTGRFRNAEKKIAAYLKPGASGFPAITGAIVFQNSSTSPVINGTQAPGIVITGFDTNLDGSPGPGPHVHGISSLAPNTVANLLSNVNPTSSITGLGGTPSATIASDPIDLAKIEASVIANADLVVGGTYNNVQWGDSSTGDWKVVYAPGSLTIKGTSGGAGILYVKGKLKIEPKSFNDFEWHGVIIDRSEHEWETSDKRSITVRGAYINTKDSHELEKGFYSYYCSEAIKEVGKILPMSLSGGDYSLAGWRVLPRD